MICTSVWPYLPLKKAYGLMCMRMCLYGGAEKTRDGTQVIYLKSIISLKVFN